jgi:mannose/fructose/N-acetylgalactosamine-specific phosphotransferase system component IIB
VAFVRCRIDDRLVHSEVLYGELEARVFGQLLIATRLPWVAALDLALVPPAVRAEVVVPEAVPAHLGSHDALVVVGTPAELAEAVAAGFRPDVVVLANRARHGEAQPVSPTVWLDEQEWAELTALAAQGLTLGVQRTPSEPFVPLEPTSRDAADGGAAKVPETDANGGP